MAPKQEILTRSKLAAAEADKERKRRLSIHEDPDDSSDNESNPDDMDLENETTMQEYRKFLSKIFPSKYLDDKIKNGAKKLKLKEKKGKKMIVESDSDESEYQPTDEDEDIENTEDEEDEDEDIEDTEDEDEEYQPPTKKIRRNKGSPSKPDQINICLQLSPFYSDDQEEDEEDVEDEEDEADEEDEDDEEEEEEEEEEDEEEEDEDVEDEDEDEEIKDTKTKSNSYKKESCKEVDDLLKMIKSYDTDNKSPVLKNCISACEKEITKTKKKEQEKINKEKDKNIKKYKQLMSSSSSFNELTSFRKLTLPDQERILEKIKEVNKFSESDKCQVLELVDKDIPISYKATALKKINNLKFMDRSNSEYHKLSSWMDAFMKIPFNHISKFPITIDDGIDKCHDYMLQSKQVLDEAVYGLNDAKMQIMQMVGQLITNPDAVGCAVALKGPMGTGKTTLVKQGISKMLNRPFAFIALGGATDSCFLEGHSYTYEGSSWGKIVQILIESKCMNPIIYFDELDKISDTPKGEEITGILTHLTDTSQNSEFHDKYFSDIDFDLSKCMFIFSYNDESKINPILKDRMYRIETKGYNLKQKTIIAEKHLIPSIRKMIKLSEEEVVFPKEIINYIIENHAEKEDGVRNLKRCLEIVFTKLNLFRLIKPDTQMFEGEVSLNINFPVTITKEMVDKLIKMNKDDNMSFRSLYI